MRIALFVGVMFAVPRVCLADVVLPPPLATWDGISVQEPSVPVVVPPRGASKMESKAVAEHGKGDAGAGETLEPPAALGLGPPADTDKVPVLAHIAGTGAKLIDLGFSHGLRNIFARQGEQFMLMSVTPDGQAVVAGLQSDLTVARLLTIAGSQVTEIGTAHGLRGLFVRNGAEFQVLYVTPDGERVIPGVMWDDTGKNVTRAQVAPVAGAVPSAVVGPGEGGAAAPAPGPRAALDLVQDTSFGTMGASSAPRLWVFVDPMCSYSFRTLTDLRPFVASGRVQVAIIPVSVLDYEDQGKSTPAALALLDKPVDQMVEAWSRGDVNGKGSVEAERRLRANMAAAEAIGLRGTPALVWRKADGSEGRVDGLPPDWNAVIASMGGKSNAAAER